jgi:hypothetical protein
MVPSTRLDCDNAGILTPIKTANDNRRLKSEILIVVVSNLKEGLRGMKLSPISAETKALAPYSRREIG